MQGSLKQRQDHSRGYRAGGGDRGVRQFMLLTAQGPTFLILWLQCGQTFLFLLFPLPPPFQQLLAGFFRDIIIRESA